MELVTKHSNKVTLKAKEISKKVMEHTKTLTKNVDATLLKSLVKDVKLPTSAEIKENAKKLLKSVDNLDRAFDDLDIEDVQKKLEEAAMTALRKASDVTRNGLKLASNGF